MLGKRKGVQPFTYDMIMMVGMIFLVGLIIYLTVNYGTDKVERLMESSPKYAQQFVASSLSIMSTHDGNFTAKLFLDERLVIKIDDNRVSVETKIESYVPDTKGSYGEYINPEADTPFVFIKELLVQERTVDFRPPGFVEVAKIDNVIGVGAE